MIKEKGINEFEKTQLTREKLLKEMLDEFNEGRSKTFYCIASTVFEVKELKEALSEAKKQTKNLGIKEKSRILHQILAETAKKRNYLLRLRKKET